VIGEVLHPGEVGVAARGQAELMSLIAPTLRASRRCHSAALPAAVGGFGRVIGAALVGGERELGFKAKGGG